MIKPGTLLTPVENANIFLYEEEDEYREKSYIPIPGEVLMYLETTKSNSPKMTYRAQSCSHWFLYKEKRVRFRLSIPQEHLVDLRYFKEFIPEVKLVPGKLYETTRDDQFWRTIKKSERQQEIRNKIVPLKKGSILMYLKDKGTITQEPEYEGQSREMEKHLFLSLDGQILGALYKRGENKPFIEKETLAS